MPLFVGNAVPTKPLLKSKYISFDKASQSLADFLLNKRHEAQVNEGELVFTSNTSECFCSVNNLR